MHRSQEHDNLKNKKTMIPTLIYLMLRKFRSHSMERQEQIRRVVKQTLRAMALLFLFVLIGLYARSQEQQKHYLVKRKGKDIGMLVLTSQRQGNRLYLKAESEIYAWAVVMLTIKTQEECLFENGTLVYSSVIRKNNGREKLNQLIRLSGTRYLIARDDSIRQACCYPISFNMLSLYGQEPLAQTKVFSDAYQCLLDIESLGSHHYRIRFPDGNHNEYNYQNGVCTSVKVFHKPYNLSFELQPEPSE